MVQIVEWALVALVLPSLILFWRISVKWTTMEGRIEQLVDDLHQLSVNSEQRIRWLEENTWKKGDGDAIRDPPRRQ